MNLLNQMRLLGMAIFMAWAAMASAQSVEECWEIIRQKKEYWIGAGGPYCYNPEKDPVRQCLKYVRADGNRDSLYRVAREGEGVEAAYAVQVLAERLDPGLPGLLMELEASGRTCKALTSCEPSVESLSNILLWSVDGAPTLTQYHEWRRSTGYELRDPWTYHPVLKALDSLVLLPQHWKWRQFYDALYRVKAGSPLVQHVAELGYSGYIPAVLRMEELGVAVDSARLHAMLVKIYRHDEFLFPPYYTTPPLAYLEYLLRAGDMKLRRKIGQMTWSKKWEAYLDEPYVRNVLRYYDVPCPGC